MSRCTNRSSASRAAWPIGAFAAHGLALVAAVFVGCGEPTPPPNLILVSVDTLRPDHLSTYGYVRDTSPGLSELASDGVRFTHAFAQAPWTIPSHASMLTGRYPCVHRADAATAIAATVPLLAERLRAAGYVTAAFVNSPYVGDKFGFARGFDVFENHSDDIAASVPRVLEWLQQPRHAPFFLFLHTLSVHGPYEAPPEFVRRYDPDEDVNDEADPAMAYLRTVGYHDYLRLERFRSLRQLIAHYDATIRWVDAEIARLMRRVRELHLYDGSVVVVTSDHGESLFDHEIWVGHGLFLYDDEVRVPLIIKPARRRPRHATVDTLIESVDVVPTVMDLLDLSVPAAVDGQSYADLILTGRQDGLREVAFGQSSNMGNMVYLRTPRWKYIGPAGIPARAILRWHLKPMRDEDVGSRLVLEEQLFDLATDPRERTNAAATRPEVSVELRRAAAGFLDRCAPPSGTAPPSSVELDSQDRQRLEALGYAH
jgi:arylsulfatase A-like enzyme